MKAWLNGLAVILVVGCSASSAHADKSSTVEYLPPDRQTEKPIRIPFKIDTNRESPIRESSISRRPISFEQPAAVSEYRNSSQSAYIIEFNSGAQPVASQPPTIRPSAMSPHVQEFNSLPLTAFEPIHPEERVPVKSKAHHKVQTKIQGHSQKISMRNSYSSQHLIPVQQLAVYSISDHTATMPSHSRFVSSSGD